MIKRDLFKTWLPAGGEDCQVQSERGKKSVKARHKGKSKKEISEYYSKLRKNK